jgi:hypothetical protein
VDEPQSPIPNMNRRLIAWLNFQSQSRSNSHNVWAIQRYSWDLWSRSPTLKMFTIAPWRKSISPTERPSQSLKTRLSSPLLFNPNIFVSLTGNEVGLVLCVGDPFSSRINRERISRSPFVTGAELFKKPRTFQSPVSVQIAPSRDFCVKTGSIDELPRELSSENRWNLRYCTERKNNQNPREAHSIIVEVDGKNGSKRSYRWVNIFFTRKLESHEKSMVSFSVNPCRSQNASSWDPWGLRDNLIEYIFPMSHKTDKHRMFEIGF